MFSLYTSWADTFAFGYFHLNACITWVRLKIFAYPAWLICWRAFDRHNCRSRPNARLPNLSLSNCNKCAMLLYTRYMLICFYAYVLKRCVFFRTVKCVCRLLCPHPGDSSLIKYQTYFKKCLISMNLNIASVEIDVFVVKWLFKFGVN